MNSRLARALARDFIAYAANRGQQPPVEPRTFDAWAKGWLRGEKRINVLAALGDLTVAADVEG